MQIPGVPAASEEVANTDRDQQTGPPQRPGRLHRHRCKSHTTGNGAGVRGCWGEALDHRGAVEELQLSGPRGLFPLGCRLLGHLLLPRGLLLPLGINPPLWWDHFLRPMGRWANESLNVLIVYHFLFQKGICQLERTNTALCELLHRRTSAFESRISETGTRCREPLCPGRPFCAGQLGRCSFQGHRGTRAACARPPTPHPPAWPWDHPPAASLINSLLPFQVSACFQQLHSPNRAGLLYSQWDPDLHPSSSTL